MCSPKGPRTGKSFASASRAGALTAYVLLAANIGVPARAQHDAGSASATATVERDTARDTVARGKALFAVGNFSAALGEFMRAYEQLAGDPRQGDVLNNIAVCYERMFRYDLALAHYARYLQEANPSAADRAEVEAVMQGLGDLLGTVRIRSPVRAEVWIDEHMFGFAPADLLVPAGMHAIEVRARGYQSERRELRVTARTTHDWQVWLEPLPESRGLAPAYFWTGVGLTVAAAATTAALGAAALSEHAAGEDETARGLRVDGRDARDLAFGADIALGSMVALGVGTAVLFFLTDWEDRPSAEAPPASGATATVSAHVSPHAWLLTVSGTTP